MISKPKLVALILTPLLVLVVVFPYLRRERGSNARSILVDVGDHNPMVLVPAGWYTMGSDSGEADERPSHQVWVDSFMIDKFPVVNALYAVFIEETGHRKPLFRDEDQCSAPLQPVVGVSWDDALAYCEWRSRKEGGLFRLPTEAEWEKAARGEDRRTYPWGNDIPTKRHADTRLKEKMPEIGTCDLGGSPYGCFDMVGNVWQWCGDVYQRDYYRHSPNRDPRGPESGAGNHRAVRGGNWVFLGCCSGTPEYALRCAQRNAFHQRLRKKTIGFRCVRELSAVSNENAAVGEDDTL